MEEELKRTFIQELYLNAKFRSVESCKHIFPLLHACLVQATVRENFHPQFSQVRESIYICYQDKEVQPRRKISFMVVSSLVDMDSEFS